MKFICLDDNLKLYRGRSGKYYQFKAREPLDVEDLDIPYFQGKPDTFVKDIEKKQEQQKPPDKKSKSVIKKSDKNRSKANISLANAFEKKDEPQTPIEKGKKLKESIKKKQA